MSYSKDGIKCTKFDFRWGCTPDPVWGPNSASPNPLTAFRGPTSNGRGREMEGKGGEENERGKGRKGGEGLAYSTAAALGHAKPRAGSASYNHFCSTNSII